MGKKTAFVINCSFCDTRNVQESTLANYEKVVINASTVAVSPQSRALLDQYSVVINASSFIEAEGEIHISEINGKASIRPGQPVPDGNVLLLVNGKLDIAPGSEEILKQYCGIQINGSVTCPESIAGLLTRASINGSVEAYPDGCILLKRTAVLDRTFSLRAQQDARYYAARRVVALADGVEAEKLAAKRVRFVTRELLVTEGLAEAVIPLFDEQAEITILPDGCAYVGDDATLDEALIRRYGGKLYIRGDLIINAGSAPWLERIEFLHVLGDVLVTKDLANLFLALDATYQNLKIIAGRLISDKISVTVDRSMLEQAEDGLSLSDCVNVKFREDIPPELIRERLVSLTDCVSVKCTPEQRGAIELVSNDVVSINDSGKGIVEQASGILGQLGSVLGSVSPDEMTLQDKAKLLMNSKMVNASRYTL